MFRFILSILCFSALSISTASASSLGKDLSQSLREGRSIVTLAQTRIQDGKSPATELARLAGLRNEIAAIALLTQEQSSTVAAVAARSSRGAERHHIVSSKLDDALTDLLAKLDAVLAGGDESALTELLATINRLLPVKSRPIHGTLPYRHQNYPPREPATTPAIQPAYKGGDRSVVAADTASSPEVPLTPTIVDKAQELQWNPVLIYEWVKNSVETEWYYGVMKGAEETLRQRSGNDADQALLLVSLLRASGFPARFVRGSIELFPDLDKAKLLTGLDDPAKIATFFQKAGIPYKPVISGGSISNFQLEHIWVESQIPYGNSRGAINDGMNKTWLALDTSIKPHGMAWNTPLEIPGFPYDTLRYNYLQTVQAVTPLEYVKTSAENYLTTNNPGKTWQDLLSKGSIFPDILKIIPASLQFKQIAITGEYQSLPEELKHKLTISATSNNSELFTITLDSQKLSNRKLALRAEPETVEDQNTIDSFGGLDNTPAYLVRLRPVLTLDGERIIVAQDGLPMGSDFTLNIDIITPNGTERISSNQIAGNLAVIGIVGQKAITPAAISEDDDAEAILHKEATSYIDRWNKSEDDLAALMGQRISRPTLTIAITANQLEVTSLLDIPHDIQWQGVYLDAAYKRIETTGRNGMERDFMRLSALEGSILENRIFEDDFQVDSISTAKLLQLARINGTSIVIIDKSNIDAATQALPYDQAVKDDIANAVNQNFTVTIPITEITHQDWSGIGYIKENKETGESGWMLSGGIAGSSTAVSPEKWVKQNFMAILRTPYSGKNVNRDPLSASRIILISSSNQQFGTVNKKLDQPLAVLVVDAKNKLVKGARVTFKSIAGGGGFDAALSTTSVTVVTEMTGIAKVPFYLGKKTGENPIYSSTSSLTPETTQLGLNLVTVSVETANVPIPLADAFNSYALPDKPVKLVKGFGDNASNIANNPAGSLKVTVEDKYDNPVSNVMVQFEAVGKELAVTSSPLGEPAPLPADARNVTFYKPEACTVHYPLFGECSSSETLPRISGYSGAFVNTILGDTVNTKYTVDVTAPGYPALDKVTFTLSTEGYRSVGAYLPPALLLRYLEQYTDTGVPVNATRVSTKLSTPLTAEMLIYMDDYTMQSAGYCSDPDYHANISYPCWQIVPSGKTIVQKIPKGKGTVTFTASGSGTMSATRDMDNGKYEADFIAGSIPERSQVAATGSATVTVPEAFADPDTGRAIITGYPLESLTADKKQLIPRNIEKLPINNYILFKKKLNATTSSHDPIMAQKEALVPYTVYAVDTSLTATPGAIAISKDGRAKRDITFSYTILPANYSAIISDIDIFRKDPLTGIEERVIQLHGDSTKGAGTSTILAGSIWDVRKQYSARVTLNNGSKIEIDGDKKPVDILLGGLVPDYDHNRAIDDLDYIRAERGDKYYFWVNDDDGSGDTEGTGIPGSGSTAESSFFKVNGTRDLVDFFPVHLDLKDLLEVFDPATYSYRLRNADNALRYVVTDLRSNESGEYLAGENRGTSYVQTIAAATTFPITNTGFNFITAPILVLQPTVLENIKQGKGVVLIEGTKKTTNPLVLEVYKDTTPVYSSLKLNLSIDGVEQMFRHKNLTIEMYKIENGWMTPPAGVTPISGHHVPVISIVDDKLDRLVPGDFSNADHFSGFDADNEDRDYIHVHGYNVNGQAARGEHSEVFKRLYWSGLRARFWGVSWFGYDSQCDAEYLCYGKRSPNYHVNVRHAFNAGKLLKNFVENNSLLNNGNATISAHSLGNMVVSAAIQNDMPYARYLMANPAVAEEAYVPLADYEDGAKWTAATRSLMKSPDWQWPEGKVVGYGPFLWASEWYKQFAATDERSKLTWRNYFSKVRDGNNAGKVYTFFAPTDQAFIPYTLSTTDIDNAASVDAYKENKDNQSVTWTVLSNLWKACSDPEVFGSYAMALQDLMKGTETTSLVLNMDSMYGGWGFNKDVNDGYYTSCIDPTGICGTMPPEEANKIDNKVLKAKPFFKKNSDNADLFTDSPVTASVLTTPILERLLSNEIPALTFGVGHKGVGIFGKDPFNNQTNIDIRKKYVKGLNAPWPRQPLINYEWRHSDIFNVGYPYLYKMYDDWVSLLKGGTIK